MIIHCKSLFLFNRVQWCEALLLTGIKEHQS